MVPNRFRIALVAVACLLCVLLAYAGPKDFWEAKPYTEWSDKEVEKILLKNSPWTHTYLPNIPSSSTSIGSTSSGGSRGGGSQGGSQIIINWYSRPIREAVVRQILLNRPDAPKAQLDQILNHKSEYLEMLVTGYSLGGGRSRGSSAGEDPLARFKKDTCIVKKDNTRIPLVNVLTPKTAGGAATLQFAKEVDGKPAITAEDKEVTLQIRFGESVFKFKFKMADMMVRGELAI